MKAPKPFPSLPAGWTSWDQIMERAYAQAALAAENGEVPVGAVIISPDGEILAEAANAPISTNDPTAHAEILALRLAAEKIQNYRLTDCIAAVTLEPCIMCLGAFIHARIGGLVFGADDPKSGAVVSCLDGANLDFVNHHFPVMRGVMAEECSEQLRAFFKARRKKKKAEQSPSPLAE
ncbi:tRNA adenosine(34) deaminase TadA [Desulfobaculum bizertense]|uniref:tRNA adenosine(34) deaminase TadA n=1 Tax=Desulfobaculum bizertense TaxID=376490 RepID=UPI001F254C9A|nr:tRNA adenosine(34) deaminase TadA [Desulfobaculum bizertense]UIJ38749.1 tRNA adenosine(34) deaminase TadA [Desulfobaculum bizertense]